jgi:hypothetical protein
MKHLIIFSFLLISIPTFSKIWIVDSNPGSTAKDFADLTSAQTGAAVGDTLYLIGSPVYYTGERINLTKRLVIIGPGYFLNENPDTQTNINPASIWSYNTCEAIIFEPGSSGTVLMGVTVRGSITVNANNILIKRNHFALDPSGSCNNSNIINASNVILVQNYIETIDGSSTPPLVQVTAGRSGIIFANNYFSHNCSGCGGGVLALSSHASSSLEVSNNIFKGGLSGANSIIQNNFFNTDNTFVASASIVRNNIHTNGYLPAGNGNINSSPLDLRYVDLGSTDGKWKLKAGSPGIGAGFNGVDCGIFGGSEPYVLSGIPPIPTIYSLTAPSIGEKNTGLPIQIKVKSNN